MPLCLPKGYVENPPRYFADDPQYAGHQSRVYEAAAQLARLLGKHRLVDLGCGHGYKLEALANEFAVTGIDHGQNIAWCKANRPGGHWVEHDLETGPLGPMAFDPSECVVICADVIEHLSNPEGLLQTLRLVRDCGGHAVISTPDRERISNLNGPPANPCHVREWAFAEFTAMLSWNGLEPSLAGRVESFPGGPVATSIAIVGALDAPTRAAMLGSLEEIAP